MSMADKAGAAVSALSAVKRSFKKVSKKDLPIVSINPTKTAAMKAPFTEPIPP